MIDSLNKLEQAAVDWGLLPFFANSIKGFSVQEMTVPGYLFSDDNEDCWNWKGPVIERRNTAYGKFFRKKAGFVSVALLPHFLNYRNWKYPVDPSSTDGMLLDIIRENGAVTSTELKSIVSGQRSRQRTPFDYVDDEVYVPVRRHSIEGPVQRLQMGGHLLIADFRYKLTKQGERYGWGVALYSTPAEWFDDMDLSIGVTPQESFDILVNHLSAKLPGVDRKKIIRLLE